MVNVYIIQNIALSLVFTIVLIILIVIAIVIMFPQWNRKLSELVTFYILQPSLIKTDINKLKKFIVKQEDKNYLKYQDVLTSLFNMALDQVPQLMQNQSLKMGNSEKLTMYSLYKQALNGDANNYAHSIDN